MNDKKKVLSFWEGIEIPQVRMFFFFKLKIFYERDKESEGAMDGG